jgi:hypothetical protein
MHFPPLLLFLPARTDAITGSNNILNLLTIARPIISPAPSAHKRKQPGYIDALTMTLFVHTLVIRET